MSFSDWLSLIWHILYPSIVVFVVLFAVWRITAFLINGFKRLIQKIDGTYPTNQNSLEGYNGKRYRIFRKKDKYDVLDQLMDDMNRQFQEDSLRFSEESLRESMRFQEESLRSFNEDSMRFHDHHDHHNHHW
jgi:hypothetical protein